MERMDVDEKHSWGSVTVILMTMMTMTMMMTTMTVMTMTTMTMMVTRMMTMMTVTVMTMTMMTVTVMMAAPTPRGRVNLSAPRGHLLTGPSSPCRLTALHHLFHKDHVAKRPRTGGTFGEVKGGVGSD